MRFCYINTANVYPQDRHLINGLTELGHTVEEINEKVNKGFLFRLKNKLKNQKNDYDATIIGFTSPLHVISAWLSGRKKIIFNAVLTQYEANIISRREYGILFSRAIKWWLLDFISLHLSSKVLLESNAQIDFVHNHFFVSRKKLVLSYSGLDEKQFYFDPSIKKAADFTVLFRGRFLPESGILTVIDTVKKLEKSGIRFVIIGAGFMYREVNALLAKLTPKNIELINQTLPIEKLREKMQSCHISLGQLADHPRLSRTLPCKLFESLALKLPYITGKNKGVLELLENNKTCITVNPGDTDNLAEKILYLKNNPEVYLRIGETGYNLYKERLTSSILAKDVLNKIF